MISCDTAPQIALKIVINALDDAIILSGYKPIEKFLDDSELWRPAIEDHEQNFGHGDVRYSSNQCCCVILRNIALIMILKAL